MNPFTSSSDDSPSTTASDHFDDPGSYAPAHLPEPGPTLEGHQILTGEDHVAVHARVEAAFEACGVYDVTFGYNLAQLNRDRRHPDAGFRYATDRDDPSVLRVEFTPTVTFCPQGEALSIGAYRALVRERDRFVRAPLDYDTVRVRIARHHGAEAVNERLRALEAVVDDAGSLPDPNSFG